MAIPAFNATQVASPEEPNQGMSKTEFRSKADTFVSWFGPFNDYLGQLVDYLNSLNGHFVSSIEDIEEARDSAITSINNTKSSGVSDVDNATAAGLSSIQSSINTAAANAAATVESTTLGVDVNLAENGTYTFPASMTKDQRVNIYPQGDMRNNPAVITLNGHKLMGESMVNFEYETNMGLTFYYVDAAFGLGIKS